MSMVHDDDIRISDRKETEKEIKELWAKIDMNDTIRNQRKTIKKIIGLEGELTVLDYRIELDL